MSREKQIQKEFEIKARQLSEIDKINQLAIKLRNTTHNYGTEIDENEFNDRV